MKFKNLVTILVCGVLVLFFIGCQEKNAYLKNVKFKVTDEITGEPIRNRELNICNNAVEFKRKSGEPSPYLNKDADFYITSVTPDDNGIFIFDLSKIQVMDFVVIETSEPYNSAILNVHATCHVLNPKTILGLCNISQEQQRSLVIIFMT